MPESLILDVYDGSGWTGAANRYEGEAYLDKNNRMVCRDFAGFWHDRIDSLKISWKTPDVVKTARGSWVNRLVANPKTRYTVTTEFASGSTTEERKTMSNELTVAMESGFAFGDLSISNAFTYGIESATTTTMSQTTTTAIDIECMNPDNASRIGIWQFKVSTENGAPALLNAFACRYGDDATKPPACPYTCCMVPGDDCQNCAADCLI